MSWSPGEGALGMPCNLGRRGLGRKGDGVRGGGGRLQGTRRVRRDDKGRGRRGRRGMEPVQVWQLPDLSRPPLPSNQPAPWWHLLNPGCGILLVV